jgi:hypothetical protein
MYLKHVQKVNSSHIILHLSMMSLQIPMNFIHLQMKDLIKKLLKRFNNLSMNIKTLLKMLYNNWDSLKKNLFHAVLEIVQIVHVIILQLIWKWFSDELLQNGLQIFLEIVHPSLKAVKQCMKLLKLMHQPRPHAQKQPESDLAYRPKPKSN